MYFFKFALHSLMSKQLTHASLDFHTVLLANVSALSAIRYLRKYIKMEAETTEKTNDAITPDSWCDLLSTQHDRND